MLKRTGKQNRTRRGAAIVYVTVSLVTMVGFCSLAVDVGRAQLSKTQLHRVADSAARSAALGIPTGSSYADAANIASFNLVDGTPVTIKTTDVVLGYWDTSTRTFTAGGSNINAAHVTVHRTKANGNPITLYFAQVLGFNTVDVSASATAMLIPPLNINDTVQATANPFLAGMPNGSEASNINPHNSPDFAGAMGTAQNTAVAPQDSGLTITGGQALTFTGIAGTAGHDPSLPSYEPDGETGEGDVPSDIGHNNLSTSESGDYTPGYNNQNGIADANIPINALVGVFLSDSQPSDNNAPANLDFSTVESRNFTTLQPALQQIFFIGDGLTDSGVQQNFIAPKGATRLFLATWDFYQWNNNYGYRTVQVSQIGQVVTVQ
jgi:Flp pilus assembly protein TadG